MIDFSVLTEEAEETSTMDHIMEVTASSSSAVGKGDFEQIINSVRLKSVEQKIREEYVLANDIQVRS